MATACSRRTRPPAWGSRGASPLLCSTNPPTRVRVALRTATAAPRDTIGPRAPSVAARQCCGAKAGIQAVGSQRRASTHVPTQQELKGEKRSGRPWCSRRGDGVGVAGLTKTGRRCSGDVVVHVVALLPWFGVVVRALGPNSGSSLAQRNAAARAACPFPPNGAARQRAPAFSFLSEPAAEQRWRKTPSGVVGLVSYPNCSPPLLNPRRGASRRKGPPCPWLAAASGQVAPAVMLARLGCSMG
jgi:hypothetical protein